MPRSRRQRSISNFSQIGKVCHIDRLLPSYEYTPLPSSSTQFRIFTLLPSPDKNATLEGALRIENMQTEYDKTCPYEALSYVWGEELDPAPLSIAGEGQVRITRNLAEALRHIRLPCEPRKLWVDALCINQRNSLEKNDQVRQMYRTFATASRVIIWLGLADEDSDYALTHLESLKTASRRNLARIATIFQRSWSSRIWTFQEALAANADSIVMCGDMTVPWQNVLAMLKDLLERARSYPDISIHRLRYFLQVHALHKTSQRLTLDKLMMATSDRRATDARDYVYALLGLINDDHHQDFTPDYSQEVSAVFERAMVSILKSQNSLDLIIYKTLARGHDPYDTSQSSWCIPYTEKEALQHLGEHYMKRRFSIRRDGAANGISMATFIHDVEKGTVKLTGTFVGFVSGSSRMDHPRWPSSDRKGLPSSTTEIARRDHKIWETVYAFFIHIDNVTSMARKQWERVNSRYADDKISAGHVWKLLANGRHMEYILNEKPQTNELYEELRMLQCATTDWRNMIGESSDIANRDLTYYPISHETHDLCRDFTAWVIEKSHDFSSRILDALFTIVKYGTEISVFKTHDGYVGSCHRIIENGDVLCILLGCKVPLVLRRDYRNCFRIIGAAYVDGIMGAAFIAIKRNYTELVDFRIE